MFTRAITRRPSEEMVNGITSANLGKPDFALALKQHDIYCQTLADLGLDVTVLDAEPGYPDCCFVEDTAVVCAHVAVLTPLGAPSRQGEQKTIEPELAKHKPLVKIAPPALIEGGDVLQVEDTFYVGLSDRTNNEGALALAHAVAPHGYKTEIIACCPSLHFKTDVNFIGNNTLLLSPCCNEMEQLSGFKRIIVDDDEAYARNCLYINGTVIVPDGFPKTLEKVRATGIRTVVIDVSEFRKLDGGLTCLSLRF
ncbi:MULTISPECIES: arginine deiminase family protein [unclassified Pseudodesulfovibrio]|uniref:dimethylarginine dimethylaminohydrolase family protein n=1 Tax=unclassified Pseudodesulfovibrio TaxID=2661612 RepID=UPI000FEBA9FF|nr:MULTISPECIES: arginine deiminase family protein [unclassified Pseudodesulfovibrio]MCJ2164285.1 arginine deiminase family protein [Pseudodesulfovibrio sp. S3-i]RWU04496.1 amidinotransferase [Pseudodesulfovibrio sp. S3]